MNHGKRRYPALDVVKMFSTLTLDHWKDTLLKATKSGNIDKLMSWRYGLQAGLADAVASGFKDEKLDLWVIKRCHDIEKCARFIIKKKFLISTNPVSKTHKGKRIDYAMTAVEAKRKQMRELENFLMRSSF